MVWASRVLTQVDPLANRLYFYISFSFHLEPEKVLYESQIYALSNKSSVDDFLRTYKF